MSGVRFEYDFLDVEVFEKRCVLTLNRPKKRNALSKDLRTELLDFLARCEKHFQVVILTGADVGFCAGLDLTEAPGEAASREMWAIAKAIYDCRSIFIAAVNGAARGGGLTLVTACDLAIAVPEATFGIPEIGFGVYATVAAPTLQFAAPKKLVAKMVLTGVPISADEAARGFLINDVVPADKLLSSAAAIADQLVKLSPDALAIAKQGINRFPIDNAMRDAAVELSLSLNAEIRGDA